MSKQTPLTVMFPDHGVLRPLNRVLADVFRKIRNDLDNGATTFTKDTVDHIANVDVTEWDDGQMKLVQDTSDNNVYAVWRYGDDLYYSTALTKIV